MKQTDKDKTMEGRYRQFCWMRYLEGEREIEHDARCRVAGDEGQGESDLLCDW